MKKSILIFFSIIMLITLGSCSQPTYHTGKVQSESDGVLKITAPLTLELTPILSDRSTGGTNISIELSPESELNRVVIYVTSTKTTIIEETELGQGKEGGITFPVFRSTGDYTIHAKSLSTDGETVFIIRESSQNPAEEDTSA
jgi:hypothetical protein